MAVQASPRIERSPLFTETWEGVLTRLRDMYSARSQIIPDQDISVLPVANPDALERMLQQQASVQQKRIALPVIGVGPINVSTNTDNGMNATVMRKIGAQMTIDESRHNWYMLKALPVYVTYQVTFVTDDVLTMMRMIDRWMSTEHWGFDLVVEDSAKMTFKIRVDPEKDVAVPPPAPNTAGSDQFRFTTNLKVQTYSGYIWRVPSIREFEVDVMIAKKDIPEAILNPDKYGIKALEKHITQVVLHPQF